MADNIENVVLEEKIESFDQETIKTKNDIPDNVELFVVYGIKPQFRLNDYSTKGFFSQEYL